MSATRAFGNDAETIRYAWQGAAELSGLPYEVLAKVPMPEVRFHDFLLIEPADYSGEYNRVCGRAIIEMRIAPGTTKFARAWVVDIYAWPTEHAQQYLTLIHEFLHAFSYIAADLDPSVYKRYASSEAWVEDHFNASCAWPEGM